MKYISLKHFAKTMSLSPILVAYYVIEKGYHYIMTENNGMWVVVNKYNEPMTKQDIQDKIDANKAQRYLEDVAHNGIFQF